MREERSIKMMTRIAKRNVNTESRVKQKSGEYENEYQGDIHIEYLSRYST